MRYFQSILWITLAALISACQPRDTDEERTAQAGPADARPLTAALDRKTADARKARVSDVEYDLTIELANDSDQFSGEVVIRFQLADPGPGPMADLTIDFGGGSVHKLELNGHPEDTRYNGFFLTLPGSRLHGGANTAAVRFSHPYSADGTGLHRFVDPVDGLTYLYTYLWPYYANQLFPAFDQPNLKARFALTVHAPRDWVVVSTAPGKPNTDRADRSAGDGTATWRFETTPRLATYAFSLHAGPYTVWEADADGIPMRLLARQSLAEFVAVDEWFEVSRRGLRYFGEYFEIPYPFGKYDQLIVPDFAIGAMENVAAVTFGEQFVQRQVSDRAERESRAGVILHEMAHMWFGDLVTHYWWNGLWLNESFATQMAAMAKLETTEFSDAWHGFVTGAKQMAYYADSRVTTHPIEVPVDSTADFFSVFDAITYQKGSSVLKQLAHYVGEENYRRGVTEYLKANAWGNTELEDFIAFQAQTADPDKDLAGWSRDWLYRAGFNTLAAVPLCEQGRLKSLTILQSAPENHPTLRRHQVDVALYSLDEHKALLPAQIIPVEIVGPETRVEMPGEFAGGVPCPAIINPNHLDWTLARIELDQRSLETLDSQLGNIPEAMARSIFLAALYHRAMTGEMSLGSYIEQALDLAGREKNIRIQQQISSSLVAAIELMQRLRPETDQALATWLPVLEERSLRHAAEARADDLKRTWFNTFLGVASTEKGIAAMRDLLTGDRNIPGLPIASDLRWRLIIALARFGEVDMEAMITAERAADDSDFGIKSALTASAALPDRAQKEDWLRELQSPENLVGLAKQRAVMAGLFPANQTMLQLEFLGGILQSLPALSHNADPYFMSSYVSLLLQPICLPESSEMMQSTLAREESRLNSTALRFLREASQADAECLGLRSTQLPEAAAAGDAAIPEE